MDEFRVSKVNKTKGDGKWPALPLTKSVTRKGFDYEKVFIVNDFNNFKRVGQ